MEIIRIHYQRGEGKQPDSSLNIRLFLVQHFVLTAVDANTLEGIQAITEYIRWNFREELTLDEISGHFHMSAPYFSRYFREKTGQTQEFVFHLNHVKDGKYIIKKRSISRNQGNVQETTNQMSPENGIYIHPNDLNYLKNSAVPQLTPPKPAGHKRQHDHLPDAGAQRICLPSCDLSILKKAHRLNNQSRFLTYGLFFVILKGDDKNKEKQVKFQNEIFPQNQE